MYICALPLARLISLLFASFLSGDYYSIYTLLSTAFKQAWCNLGMTSTCSRSDHTMRVYCQRFIHHNTNFTLCDWRLLLLSDNTVLLCDVIVRTNICIFLERNIYKGVLMLQDPFNKILISVFYYV